MSGLYLFAVVGLLGYLAWKLSALAVRRIPNPWLGKGCQVLLTVLLMGLLVADEIIGGFQFRKLCEQNAVLRIDPEKARGRTVKVVIEPSNEMLPTIPIHILHSHLSFRDVVTNEEIAQYDWYVAKGGWFIRTLGISGSNSPITMGRSSCTPQNAGTFPKEYGFTLIN
jgi:hypothetical protein